ncbi:MAG: tetratricopeptide repeat protein, partial [Deltaproteobacteria bacterium]|nr:tetratricopeptide repeat protein [Deltaproteobacteria bacterium]
LQQGGAYFTGFAETYLGNGDKDDARDLLEKAKNYNLQPVDKQRVSRTLALLYIEEDMLNDAHRLCNSIIEGDRLLPDDELADVYFISGRILNLQKRYSDAEAVINSAPGMPDRIKDDLLISAYMELGKAYYHTGNYPKAASSFEKGFDLGYAADNRDYWNLRLDLAQAYMSAGEHDRARVLFTEISEGGDNISQQRAALKIGSMDLEEQLKRLPMGGD